MRPEGYPYEPVPTPQEAQTKAACEPLGQFPQTVRDLRNQLSKLYAQRNDLDQRINICQELLKVFGE